MSSNIKDLISYSPNINVLFAEDNHEVKVQLLKFFRNFFPNIDEANDGKEALEMYNKYKTNHGNFYDLVITDISMPKLDGIELSRNIMKQNQNQIILVISAHTDSEKVIELLNIGVYKFIQKPVEYNTLISTLSSIISKIKREKTFLQNDNKDSIDKLTSIYSREYINYKIYESIQNINKELSIMLIDIDDFKIINKMHGKDIGDKTLISFANLINENIKDENIFGRWAGEVFIIVLENKSKKESIEIAKELREKIVNHQFEDIGKLTASFSISSYEKGDNKTTLIQKADFNLYKAKEHGKNTINYSC